jgi:hypothetical protein
MAKLPRDGLHNVSYQNWRRRPPGGLEGMKKPRSLTGSGASILASSQGWIQRADSACRSEMIFSRARIRSSRSTSLWRKVRAKL